MQMSVAVSTFLFLSKEKKNHRRLSQGEQLTHCTSPLRDNYIHPIVMAIHSPFFLFFLRSDHRTQNNIHFHSKWKFCLQNDSSFKSHRGDLTQFKSFEFNFLVKVGHVTTQLLGILQIGMPLKTVYILPLSFLVSTFYTTCSQYVVSH